MLCPLHQFPPAVFGYFTVSVGIPTAGRQILKPQQFPHLLFLAKTEVLGCVIPTSAERCHWRRQWHTMKFSESAENQCLPPPQEWINTGVSDNFLSLAELLCILQRWGTAGDCNNFSSLFTPNPTAVIHSDECGFLGPPWLCWCSSFMLQLPRLSLERERHPESVHCGSPQNQQQVPTELSKKASQHQSVPWVNISEAQI